MGVSNVGAGGSRPLVKEEQVKAAKPEATRPPPPGGTPKPHQPDLFEQVGKLISGLLHPHQRLPSPDILNKDPVLTNNPVFMGAQAANDGYLCVALSEGNRDAATAEARDAVKARIAELQKPGQPLAGVQVLFADVEGPGPRADPSKLLNKDAALTYNPVFRGATLSADGSICVALSEGDRNALTAQARDEVKARIAELQKPGQPLAGVKVNFADVEGGPLPKDYVLNHDAGLKALSAFRGATAGHDASNGTYICISLAEGNRDAAAADARAKVQARIAELQKPGGLLAGVKVMYADVE
jgi:hypothetical protein